MWLDGIDREDDPRHRVSPIIWIHSLILTWIRMTCRLPQTPRTPTGAASHYFDDVFTTTGKPKKPHHLRRSSTNRSIGFRSDWETSTNGEDEDVTSPAKRKNSVGVQDAESIRQKLITEERLNHYVSGQLQRIKTGMNDCEPDEFETTTDGASDDRPKNGQRNGHSERGSYFEEDPYFSR